MTGPTAQTGYPATGYPVTEYPVQFSVDYPDRPLSRLSTVFWIFLVIPIGIVLSTVSGPPACQPAATLASLPARSATRRQHGWSSGKGRTVRKAGFRTDPRAPADATAVLPLLPSPQPHNQGV
jgi:hypothetical protein